MRAFSPKNLRRTSVIAAAVSLVLVVITSLVGWTDMLTDSSSRLTIALVASMLAAFTGIQAAWILRRARTKKRVFLIYAREDVAAARRLANALSSHGFNVWIDVQELSPGQVWNRLILEAIEESVVAVVLVSDNLKKRGFVHSELKAALASLQAPGRFSSPIIPVRLEETEVPEMLASFQWVDLFRPDGMDKLVAGLNLVVHSDARSLSQE